MNDLNAALDAFEKPGTVQYSTTPHVAVPLQDFPEPEPAEPWHNEPIESPPTRMPAPVARVEPQAAIPYRPDAPKPARKTPDEMTWRECWLRIGKLYSRGHMDAAQYHDLIHASSSWRKEGSDKPPADLLDKVRTALWQFESVDEERERGRTGNPAQHRRGDPGAGLTDQRLREHDAAG
jgi:hypothetical protein